MFNTISGKPFGIAELATYRFHNPVKSYLFYGFSYITLRNWTSLNIAMFRSHGYFLSFKTLNVVLINI